MKSSTLLSRNYITYAILLFIILINVGLKFHNLGYPSWFYYDESFFGYTAKEMAEGNFSWHGQKDLDRKYILNYQYLNITPKKYNELRKMPWGKSRKHENVAYEWTHPPFGKELSALGVLALGYNPLGWRFVTALFGVLGCVFIFLLGRELFKSNSTGIFAAFLYTFDSLVFVESRASLTDIYLLCFIMLSSLFFIKHLRTREKKFLILTALFCGMGVSVKWTGVFPPVLFSIIIGWNTWKSGSYGFSEFVRRWFKDSLLLSGITIFFYVFSYLPFFLKGMGVSEFLKMHLAMINYHINVKSHIYQSSWWSWPLMLRPARFEHNEMGQTAEYIYALGNPVIWWAGLLCIFAGAVKFFRDHYRPLGFVLASYVFYMIPWAISPRSVTFIYHYLPSLLFLILMSSYFMDLAWKRSKSGRVIVLAGIALVIAMFIYLYPVTTGIGIKISDLDKYLLFSSWK